MLDEIIQSIIPDNIKRIPVVETVSKAFSEMLSKNSQIAIRIRQLFDIDSKGYFRRDSNGNLEFVPDKKDSLKDIDYYLEVLSPGKIEKLLSYIKEQYNLSINKEDLKDFSVQYPEIISKCEELLSDYITKCKNNLKTGLFQTYLSVMYSLIDDLCKNKEIVNLVYKRNFSDKSLLVKNSEEFLDSEYLGAFRFFQESSGTEQAIRYIYQFSRYLETGKLDSNLELELGAPFFIGYRGELHRSIFNEFNKPMAHPCGWCYFYDTIMNLVLEDYYGIKFTYDIDYVCISSGPKKIYFGKLPEGVSAKNIKENKMSLIYSTLANYDIVHVISNNGDLVIQDVEFSEDTLINFGDNSLLVCNSGVFGSSQTIAFGPSRFIYSKEKFDEARESGRTCSYIIFDNSFVLNPIKINKTDYIFLYKDEMIMDDGIEISKSNAYYYKDFFDNSFKLKGSEYPYFSGVDESRHKVVSDSNILDAFTLTIDYCSANLTYLRLRDDFGNSKALVRETGNQFKVNTHGFKGENLTFEAFDGKAYNNDFYIKTNYLNKRGLSVSVSDFSIQDKKIRFKAKTTNRRIAVTVNINGTSTSRVYNSSVNFERDTSAFPFWCSYKITINDYNDIITIEGNGINNENQGFVFGLPHYPEEGVVYPVFQNCTPETMSGSQASGKTIKQLNNSLPGMTLTNEDPEISNIYGTFNVSDLKHSNYDNECLINKGFKKLESETSDNVIMDSSKYVEDSFLIESSGYSLWLEFDKDEEDGSLGKYLVCRYQKDDQTSVVRSFLRGNILMFRD